MSVYGNYRSRPFVKIRPRKESYDWLVRESGCAEVKVLELTLDLDRFRSPIRYSTLVLCGG